MADYRLIVSAHSRSKGHSATAAAAYRTASRVRDERPGELHDYSRKGGILHSEIVQPTDAPAWARNRERLWNAAEKSETRRNSTVARDFFVSLPAELTAAQRTELTVTLAGEIARRHHCAVDVALHRPTRGGDSRNFHAHLLCSTLRLRPEGFTEKTRDLDDKKSGEILYWRERWASLHDGGQCEHDQQCKCTAQRSGGDLALSGGQTAPIANNPCDQSQCTRGDLRASVRRRCRDHRH